jgi:toxin ParE1/3/4
VQVIWSPASLREVARIYRYIADFNPQAARKLAQELVVTGDSLAEFPERGRPIGRDLRELVVVWPYVIRYRIEGAMVFILRVRHGRQQPTP